MLISEDLRNRIGDLKMPYGTSAGTRFVELNPDVLEAFVSDQENQSAYPRSYQLVKEVLAEINPPLMVSDVPAEKTDEELLAELEDEETEDKAKKKKSK